MSRRAWRTGLPLPAHCPSPSQQYQRRYNFNAHARPETTPIEFAERRRRFLQLLSPHSLVLLPAADEVACSHDILHPFRQDSLWMHLFGLRIPLRRQLEPPSSSVTKDARATVAIFAKDRTHAAEVMLCVPPVTTEPSTVVWAAETQPLSFYEDLLRAPSSERSVCEVKGGAVLTTSVTTNEVSTVLDALCGLMKRMAKDQLSGLDESMKDSVYREGLTRLTPKEQLIRDSTLLMSVMPQLYMAYPQQLRWDGRRYRLSSAFLRQQYEASTKPAPTFHHPLEALLSTLDSLPFVTPLPRALAAAAADLDLQPTAPRTAAFRYKTAAAYTPGLVSPSTTEESDALGVHISSKGDSSPPSVAAVKVRLPVRRMDALAWSYRLQKCPSQLRQHLCSARATEHAFAHVMRHAATTAAAAISEHDLHCAFQRSVGEASAHFGAAACVRPAYIPVIAGGVRSTQIHYTDNDAALTAPGDVVRVDAGVEVDGVPTDCTRTFPVRSTTFRPADAQLYDGLLQIQRSLLRQLAPGVAVGDVAKHHLDATRSLLCELGVDVRSLSTPPHHNDGDTLHNAEGGVENETATREEDDLEQQLPMALVRTCFCAHSFGHLFGLDIHEEWANLPTTAHLSAMSSTRQKPTAPPRTPHVLQGGMMHTVEPGLYMPRLDRAALFGLSAAHFPEAFHGGVGMQIEDDVLVLPPSKAASADAAALCPWSRGEYLQHALAVFARYYGGETDGNSWSGSKGGPCTSLKNASCAVALASTHVQALLRSSTTTIRLCAHEQNVVHFLFTQRTAVEGYEAAIAALESDVAVVQHLRFTPNPAYGADEGIAVPDASNTDWYPFSIVVLTASVPKDRALMAALMQS